MADNFELLAECKANNVIPVYKYQSKRTRLTVVIAQVEGPLVNGYFCLGTEAHDDDGLPHTLEHLVFMGSEKYPYKGVLDLLANRCLASGTNAWTDTDHTCYTMTTAGSEGFLTLLPIYLDHILYPTLTESAYLTEVHHVNTDGENAGVVYCEMQARENTGESRTHLAMLRAMYPGQCGYKSETGGMMANLRTSTSHQKVCDYHREFYRPENLCLIITGQVDPEEVFKSLQPFEDKIVSKGPRSPFTRPWQSPVPPLEGSTNEVIKYASDEEAHGMVVMSWRAPPGKDQFEILALIVLMEYLTDTSVAPLQRDFVELDDPYCSRVRYSIIENAESCLYVTFENVPTDKLGSIHDRLQNLVAKIGGGAEAIDMSRMGSVTHRKILESMSNLEDQPHDSLAASVIADFLNSDTTEEFSVRLNHVAALRELKNKSKEFWLTMLNKYIVGKPTVTIVGEPSKKLMEETGEEEKRRIAAQREKLGPEGLDQLAKRLQQAKDENEVEAPEKVLTSVSVPDVTSIKFHGIKPSSNHDGPTADSNAKFPLADIPVTFQLDDIQTNFATMMVMMDTARVPDDLRLYMPLLLEVLMESPIIRNGILVPYEDVVRELAADTLDSRATLGLGGRKFACGQFAQVANLLLKVEREKYKRGVQWLHELLYQTRFTVDRLRIVATKMVNEVAKVRRNGHFIARTLCQAMVFTKESNHYVVSMLRQHKFLSAVLTRLDNETEAQKVIENVNSLRDSLTTPANIGVHLSISVETLPPDVKPELPWRLDFLPKESKKGEKGPTVKSDSALLLSAGVGPGSGVIVGSGSVESSYLIQTAPGITDPEDADLVAVMVFIQYLTQLEGPMWRQVRGLGLAYHYSMYIKPDSGLVYFILFKATHVVNAYKVAREIVDDFFTGKTAFSEVEFETCKSSLIFEVIEEEKTPSDASLQSALSYFRGVNHDYNRRIIAKVPKVTLDDLRRVGQKYLLPLFDTAKSKCAIVCHPSKVKEISAGFKELSRDLVEMESLENSFLSDVDLSYQQQQL